MKSPVTALVRDPKPGDYVLFKYAGSWTPGRIINTGNVQRVAIQRPDAVTPKLRRSVYWRNRTQIFEVPHGYRR